MIHLLRCGFQSGADIGAARAARAAGIPTTGWMPIHYLTEDGPRPEYADIYGAKALHQRSMPLADQYRERTRRNLNELADEAGVAVVFDADPGVSRGTRLAMKDHADRQNQFHGQPNYTLLVVRLELYQPKDFGEAYLPIDAHMTPGWLAGQIRNAQADELFVGGNRESSAHGIGAWVERYLTEVFRLMREESYP